MNKNHTNTLVYKIISRLGKAIIKSLEYFISLSVKDEFYLKPDDFYWTKLIENDFTKIKSEYDSFMSSNSTVLDICKVSEEQYNVVEENQWDFIPLYFYGTEIESFTKYFPDTIKCLAKIPGMTTSFISILKPGTFVKEHRGAYKGYLRYQIGIKIPQPSTQCGLKIKDVIYNWNEGESVIFDDTYLHTAWNNSNELRAVLYVDFIRPMNKPLMYVSRLLTIFINKSPFTQNAIRNLKKELNIHGKII